MSRRSRAVGILVPTALLATLCASPASLASSTGDTRLPAPSAAPSARVVGTPITGTKGYLRSVVALSESSAWAVGTIRNSVQDDQYRAFIKQWNGETWFTRRSPAPSGVTQLFGVDAVSATSAWAVGWNYRSGRYQPFFEQWDGVRWTHFRTSSRGDRHYRLQGGVSAVSTIDAWAVGYISNSFLPSVRKRTLIMHWDGSTWTRIDSPNRPADFNFLTSVAAVSADDVWAVGYTASPDLTRTRTLVLHWDGTRWAQVPSPSPGGQGVASLRGVSAVSPTDAWAVGYYDASSGRRTLTEHWDGTRWSRVPSPAGSLNAVSARSASDVWGVGDNRRIEHWDGTAWTTAAVSERAQDRDFYDVDARTAADAWAVGATVTRSGSVLVDRWDGAGWTPY